MILQRPSFHCLGKKWSCSIFKPASFWFFETFVAFVTFVSGMRYYYSMHYVPNVMYDQRILHFFPYASLKMQSETEAEKSKSITIGKKSTLAFFFYYKAPYSGLSCQHQCALAPWD